MPRRKSHLDCLLAKQKKKERVSLDEKIKAVIADHLEIDLALVTGDKSFSNDFNMDEIDKYELFAFVFDEKLGIKIPDEEIDRIQTVDDAIEWMKEHQPESQEKVS